MKNKSSPTDINKTLNELEKIVEKIEDSNLSLDESLKEFERGIGLVKAAQKILLNAEQKVALLVEGASGKPEEKKLQLDEDVTGSE